MKKRLLSLLLVLAVVFSFSLSAFATDTGIDIIDDPLSYYFENQMLGVQKGTGVTIRSVSTTFSGGQSLPALSSGVCSTSFWGDTMNKLPYFLVALCLCMFCSFSAYADDAADPAQADSAASSDEVVVPPEEGKVVQVQGVQTYDPQLYERMDKLQESIDALTEALIPAAEGAESSAEDAGGQDYTSQLSTISGQLVSLQEAVVMSTPESAEEPNIWDKPFNEYTPLEGYALLTFVIILAACGLSIFRRF